MTFFASLGVFIFIVPVIIGLAIFGTIWKAWWLYPAWGWFIVPLGAPPIAFWHFVGLLFFHGVLNAKIDTKKDERKESWAAYVIMFLWPIIAWAILRWLAS